jgi:uncharacterized coiled-coil protein SlyX
MLRAPVTLLRPGQRARRGGADLVNSDNDEHRIAELETRVAELNALAGLQAMQLAELEACATTQASVIAQQAASLKRLRAIWNEYRVYLSARLLDEPDADAGEALVTRHERNVN